MLVCLHVTHTSNSVVQVIAVYKEAKKTLVLLRKLAEHLASTDPSGNGKADVPNELKRIERTLFKAAVKYGGYDGFPEVLLCGGAVA